MKARKLECEQDQQQRDQGREGQRGGQGGGVAMDLRAGGLAGRAAALDDRSRTLGADEVFAAQFSVLSVCRPRDGRQARRATSPVLAVCNQFPP